MLICYTLDHDFNSQKNRKGVYSWYLVEIDVFSGLFKKKNNGSLNNSSVLVVHFKMADSENMLSLEMFFFLKYERSQEIDTVETENYHKLYPQEVFRWDSLRTTGIYG